MTGRKQKTAIRRMSDYETGGIDLNEKPLLYGGEENHGQGADAPFRGLPAAEGVCVYQQLEQPVL